jgi:hypothetical protein
MENKIDAMGQRIAIVTGSSRGMGRETSLTLALYISYTYYANPYIPIH